MPERKNNELPVSQNLWKVDEVRQTDDACLVTLTTHAPDPTLQQPVGAGFPGQAAPMLVLEFDPGYAHDFSVGNYYNLRPVLVDAPTEAE